MALQLRLRPFERVIINGCVITNGPRRNTISVSSYGQVLRGKYVLQEEDAVTPVQKLYFAIQMLLIDEDARRKGAGAANRLGSLAFIALTDEEDRARVLTAMEWVHRDDFYKALGELRPLLDARSETPAGESAPASEADEAGARPAAEASAKMHCPDVDHPITEADHVSH